MAHDLKDAVDLRRVDDGPAAVDAPDCLREAGRGQVEVAGVRGIQALGSNA